MLYPTELHAHKCVEGALVPSLEETWTISLGNVTALLSEVGTKLSGACMDSRQCADIILAAGFRMTKRVSWMVNCTRELNGPSEAMG